MIRVEALPTEQRLLQKAKAKHDKELGITPRKRPMDVEQHFDDCGSDLAGLDFVTDRAEAAWSKKRWEDDDHLHTYCDVAQVCEDANTFDLGMQSLPCSWKTAAGHSFEALLSTPAQGRIIKHEVMEVMGGLGVTTQILVRRQFVGGRNFDLRVSVDLTKAREIQSLWDYMAQHRPDVVIMAPPCRGLKGWIGINAKKHPEQTRQTQEKSLALGNLCGQIALFQARVGRHWLVEQPQGSLLYQQGVWLKVAVLARWCFVDQCMAGLRGRITGLPIRKRSEFWASDDRLLRYLRPLTCDNKHPHAVLGGWRATSNREIFTERAKDAEVWPYDLCLAIAKGVYLLLRGSTMAYPTQEGGSASSAAPASAAAVPTGRCPGCTTASGKPAHRARDHPLHNRIVGQCRYPFDEVSDECPGCAAGRPRYHHDHTLQYGKCRWALAGYRAGMPRGQHPRDPRVPAATDPTAAQPAGTPRADSGDAQREDDAAELPAEPVLVDEPADRADSQQEPREPRPHPSVRQV